MERYEPVVNCEYGSMEIDPDGNWVKYDDVQLIYETRADLLDALEVLTEFIENGNYRDYYPYIEVDNAKKAITKITGTDK